MAREKICGIYKITNQVNGKVYIGQSIDILSRWQEHKSKAYNQNAPTYEYPLYCDLRKYGSKEFKFEILERCSLEILNQRERHYISLYESYPVEHGKGYNQIPGGDSLHKLNPKTPPVFCQCGVKIGKNSKTGLCRKCFEAQAKIKIPSKEQLLKDLYEMRVDQKVAEKYNISTMLLKKWKEELDIPRKRPLVDKMYQEEYLGIVREEKPKRKINFPIVQLDKDTGDVIQTFENISSASLYIQLNFLPNTSLQNISQCINKSVNNIKVACGYRWERLQE